jgi:hypothetical protein
VPLRLESIFATLQERDRSIELEATGLVVVVAAGELAHAPKAATCYRRHIQGRRAGPVSVDVRSALALRWTA